MLVADTARGDGSDKSVFHIICNETSEQVAEYQGKLNFDVFSHLIFSSGLEYNRALVVVENNTYGFRYSRKIKRTGIPKFILFNKKST